TTRVPVRHPSTGEGRARARPSPFSSLTMPRLGVFARHEPYFRSTTAARPRERRAERDPGRRGIMDARVASGSERPAARPVLRLGRLLVLFLPVTLLLAVSGRAATEASTILWLGTLFQALACGLALWTSAAGREPAGPAVIMLYVIALSWLLLGGPGREDW